jgi:hypothetical protein
MARLLGAPKVVHKVRLTNKSSYPLTTAPALIVRDSRVLAQGMMTYTAVNATSDLEVTKAVDIQVAKSDAETARVPTAVRWQGTDYARVDLAGTITLTNHRDKAVDVEGRGACSATSPPPAARRRGAGEYGGGQRAGGRFAGLVALVRLAELVGPLQRRRAHHVESAH